MRRRQPLGQGFGVGLGRAGLGQRFGTPSAGGGPPITPPTLGPYAWYDAHLGGSSTQIVDSSANGRTAATLGASTAAPVWLPYSEPSVYVPSGTGNYVTCPSTGWSPLQDMQIIACVTPDAWVPASNATIAAQWGGTLQWTLDLRTGGTFRFSWVDSTPTTRNFDSSAHGLTGSSKRWIRIRVDADNGAAGTSVTFGTSSDGVSFTDINTATVSTTATARSGTSVVSFGSQGTGGQPLSGRLHSLAISNATSGGTVVAAFDAEPCGQTGYAGTNVWTVTRATSGRKVVVQSPAAASTRGLYLFGTDDLVTVPATAVPALGASDTATVLAVFRRWATFATSARIFDNRGSATETALGVGLRSDATTASTTVGNAGDGAATISDSSASYFQSGVRISGGLRIGATLEIVKDGTVSTGAARANPATSSSDLTVGAVGTASNFTDMELEAVATFDRALNPGELAKFAQFYRAGS